MAVKSPPWGIKGECPLCLPQGRTRKRLKFEKMEELDKNMYFGTTPKTLEKAKQLRKNMTNTEKLLWNRLNKKQILNLRFRRQHPIDIFIADFYCHAARLIIELDGKIHESQKDYDTGRTGELERFDIQVIRFTNDEVDNNIDDVIKQVETTIIQRLKSPPWGI